MTTSVTLSLYNRTVAVKISTVSKQHLLHVELAVCVSYQNMKIHLRPEAKASRK